LKDEPYPQDVFVVFQAKGRGSQTADEISRVRSGWGSRTRIKFIWRREETMVTITWPWMISIRRLRITSAVSVVEVAGLRWWEIATLIMMVTVAGVFMRPSLRWIHGSAG